jgi:HEAT repeat protein
MVQWYCPACFAEVGSQTAPCPRCGDLGDTAIDFEESLIRALGHPLPDRRLLAAQVLGQRRARGAVPGLIAAVEQGDDPYLAAEAVVALARIGDPGGLAIVDQMAREGPAVARAAARAALRERSAAPSGSPAPAEDGG